MGETIDFVTEAALWGVFGLLAYVLWPVWLSFFQEWNLGDAEPDGAGGSDVPPVSVIVPARNEERGISECLSALSKQDYPRFEVIVVDDRSNDGTSQIARRFAASDSRFRYVRIDEVPAGWLGKNYANHVGASTASGDILLFTDADVVMAPCTLRVAVAYMERHGLDHLALLPGSPPLPILEAAAMVYFAALFVAATRASVARWYRSGYAGVGAFNMVRRRAYEATGGHARLRLEVVDDVMLGWLVKRYGFKQDARPAFRLVRVRWQEGVWGIVRGLEKNAFAGLGYSVARVAASTVFQVAAFILPIPLVAVIGPSYPLLAILVASFLTFVGTGVRFTGRLLPGLLYPVGATVLVIAVVRSAWKALRRGAIVWRDTEYPLEELKTFRSLLEREVEACAG